MQAKPTPYDTGKVKIGLLYQLPQQNEYSADQELLQRALLGERDPYQDELLLAIACLACVVITCGGLWYAGA
jgi:hypothetical protein